MKSIAEILYLARARNAEHYRLQEALLKAVTAEFATKYQLAALLKAFSDAFKNEDSIYLQTRGFADTKELADLDAERDRLFRLISLTIQSKELSLDEAEAEAGTKLAYVLKPYKGAASKADAENTALVSDLVKKLQAADYSRYVETLKLTSAVEKLKTTNETFDTLYSHRAGEKREKSVTDKLEDARKQTDTAFLELSKAINAIYAVNALVEKDETKETEIGAVIDAVNAEILQFSETLQRRGVGKKTKISSDNKPSTDADSSGSDVIQGEDSDGNPTFE